MEKLRRVCIAVICRLMCFVVVCVCSKAWADSYPYFVIVNPHGSLVGLDINKFYAYAFKSSKWQRVALQIDERSEDGDYVLPDGLPYTKDLGNGVFDLGDEMVFNGKDFGDDFTTSDITSELRSDKVFKAWKVHLSSGNKKYGYLLVVHKTINSDSSTQNTDSPVKFDSNQQRVSTLKFQYEFNKKQPALLGAVSLIENGKRINLIKNSQFNVPVRLPWYLPNFTIEDNDFTSQIDSWKEGSIRTIIAVGLEYRKFLFFIDLNFFTEVVIYENALQIPTVFDMTVIDPSYFFKLGTGLAYTITYDQGEDWIIDSNIPELPKNGLEKYLSGKDSKKASDYSYFYITAHRQSNVAHVKVRIDEKAVKSVPPPFLITREMFSKKSLMQKWDWFGNLSGDIGVYIDISKVQRGVHNFGLDLFLGSKAEETDSVEISSIQANWQKLPTTK